MVSSRLVVSGDFPGLCSYVVPRYGNATFHLSYFCQISDSTKVMVLIAVPNEKITWGKLDENP
jgi:hypothetical protein